MAAHDALGLCASHDPPRLVVLLRHDEKTSSGEDPNLSKLGTRRARELPPWLLSRTGPGVAAVYAMRAGSSAHRTLRPVETVTPLATVLGVLVDTRYGYGDERELARELLTNPGYSGSVVVVCWVHEQIPRLAQALGVRRAPAWKGGDYTHAWFVSFSGGAPELRVEDEPR